MSGLEQTFFALWTLSEGHERRPSPVREHRFRPERRWRFDFAWPRWGVAVELCGVMDETSKYRRARGLTRFFEKLRAAADGWTVLVYTSQDLRERPQQTIEEVEALLHDQFAAAGELADIAQAAVKGERVLTGEN